VVTDSTARPTSEKAARAVLRHVSRAVARLKPVVEGNLRSRDCLNDAIRSVFRVVFSVC
jgi:hypothetical protein